MQFSDQIFSKLVSRKEAQRTLSVGSTTLYKWCHEGKLTPIKFGPRCTRFRLAELEALIKANTAPTQRGVV